jgi:hypothetical protein
VTDATKNPDEQDLKQFETPINPGQPPDGNNNQGFNEVVNIQQDNLFIPNDDGY